MKKSFIKISIVFCYIFFTYAQIIYATQISDLKINCNSYIAYERNTKQVLFGNNIDKKVPMASTTKIMTAIIALEYGKLDEMVTVSKNAENISGWQLNLRQGDKINLEELLYATMLYSANDGAIAIAEHVAGSVENFCKMMNEKAKEIGAQNTNFTSPHGLDNDNHYSTPYDLAIITDYAMNNEKFNTIVTTLSYTIKINENNRIVNNTNKLVKDINEVTGVKTGYTGKAGYCLVSGIKTNKIDVISVILGSNTSKQRFDETKKILEYCKNNYIITDLNDYIKKEIKINIAKSDKNNILIYPKKNNKIAINKENINKIKVKYELLDNQIAPINSNTILGVGNVYINDKSEFLVEYICNEDINKINYINYFKNILFNLREYIIMN